MAEKQKQQVATPNPSRKSGHALGVGLRIAAGLAVAGLAVGGLAWVGQRAAWSIVDRERYTVKFADILCNAPPGSDRQIFLTEVRYLGEMPDSVQSIDAGLPDRLTAAFSKHPWVHAVSGVRVAPGGQEIAVDVTFRTPVLSVSVLGDPDPRAVDAEGVLLPPTAPTTGLAELVPQVFAPAVSAGLPWDDPDVRRAASLAAAYKLSRIEKTTKGWRVTRTDGTTAIIGS